MNRGHFTGQLLPVGRNEWWRLSWCFGSQNLHGGAAHQQGTLGLPRLDNQITVLANTRYFFPVGFDRPCIGLAVSLFDPSVCDSGSKGRPCLTTSFNMSIFVVVFMRKLMLVLQLLRNNRISQFWKLPGLLSWIQ
jgi:hypothetical protein